MTEETKRAEGVELKPCPFCGGEASIHEIGDEEPTSAGGRCVVCKVCAATSPVHFGRAENLKSSWNTRTPPAVAQGEMEASVRDRLTSIASDEAASGNEWAAHCIRQAITKMDAGLTLSAPAPSGDVEAVAKIIAGFGPPSENAGPATQSHWNEAKRNAEQIVALTTAQPDSALVTDAMADAAWQAYSSSTKPAPFNRVREALEAALKTGGA